MKLEPKPGFDWAKVTWGRPDSPPSVLCSYCSGSLNENDVPLMMFTKDGYAAKFCPACQSKWWGMR
jgi:hypothetical protein